MVGVLYMLLVAIVLIYDVSCEGEMKDRALLV